MKKLLCVCVLAMACLVGCGNNEGGNKETTTTPKADTPSKTEGYVFEVSGTEVGIDMLAAPIIEKLGEPNKYFESESCAFAGLDKTYDYGSYKIETYQIEGVDYISSVYFVDDMVSTKEGLSLFMTKADMEAKYGTDYKEDTGSYSYDKGDMTLRIIIENDQIVTIEYYTHFIG
ncbi:MAG: hypothetical protein E7266_02515 [Lachnospiraceae bacterium]|nr:hypothetical protein [Lachnospiraceae bacterium]